MQIKIGGCGQTDYEQLKGRISGMGIFILPLFLLTTHPANAQAPAAQAASPCALSGADTVNSGSTASFTLSPCTAGSWTASCGTITGKAPGSVTVNFALSTCGSAVISATNGATTLATRKVTVIPAPALTAGAISNTSQTINYNKTAGLLSLPVASGGACGGSYTYQWLSSTDNINFSPITGASAQNYQPGALATTTYFKRQVYCAGSATPSMTNTISVTVYPPVSGVTLSPASQSVNSNAPPVTLSLVPVTGGSGNYTYSWQSTANSSFTGPSVIGGVGSAAYTPGNSSSTTYYRVGVISNGDTVYSSPAVINVFPQLQPGSVNPATQTLAYDSIPALLSVTGVSGGSGNYAYQWYSSTDNTNWSLINGVTSPAYNPAGLTATTYYRIVVSSNGLSATGIAGVVQVNPPLQ